MNSNQMAHLFQIPLEGFRGPEQCISGGPLAASRLVSLGWPGAEESVVFASGRRLHHVSNLGVAAPRDMADGDVPAPSNRGSSISAPILRESHPTTALPSLPAIQSELQCVASRSLPGGSVLVAASDRRSNAHLWRITTDPDSGTSDSWLRSNRLESGWTSIALADDGSRCAVVHGLEQDLAILRDGREVWSCATKGTPGCVSFFDDAHVLFTEDQRLTLADTRLPARVCRVRSDAMRCPPGATLISMAVAGDQVAVVGTAGPVTLWDAARWRLEGDWAAPVKHESVCVRMDMQQDRCFVAGSGSELVSGRRSACCLRRPQSSAHRPSAARPAAKRSRTERGAVPSAGAGDGGADTPTSGDGTPASKSNEKPTRSRLDMKHAVGFRGDSRWVGMTTAKEGGSLYALSSFGHLFVARHSQRMVPE